MMFLRSIPMLIIVARAAELPENTAQVTYLGGITYILPDGCPTTDQDLELTFPSVTSTRAERDAQYRECLENESIRTDTTTDKLWTQCVTDRLPHNLLTVPVYTDICAAQCHSHLNTHKHTQNYDRNGRARYRDCPTNGRRVGVGIVGGRGSDEVDKPLADRFLG